MAVGTNNIIEAYNDFYTGSDTEWRMMGARSKARNLVEVCRDIKPSKVLEVGAGDGSILHYLNEWNFGEELYALEIADSGISLIQNRNLSRLKEVKSFDGYTIPYADNTFDVVILAHVLEHVEHERLLIRELKRVARYIAVEVPLDYRFGVDRRMKHFLDYGHINMYTPTLIRFLLQSEGLAIMAEKTSLTPVDTVKFCEFNVLKKPKTFVKTIKIELEFGIKKWLGFLLGKNKTEQFGNAYTVLTEKSTQTLQIF
ncbi:class I SAM-dependent methyltransferase [Pedobacter metabolipauper]|uniref:Ubiquinone/menaquinone biosynthesis C-methylase UbiE n=1 Tax=Pedobacter metabolipauper TaxID=425513 RepID=A0A4V3D1A0_9SPHI|nr:class I SAM-dependent methyltransferase [Pedobacter metabolipauper]TDQ09847.1 ubiquinone/menaquinone biosynthesis C-methylase UbiE [Pedobacter metabolipauper]